MDETGVLGLLEELSILLEDSKPVFGKSNLRQVDIAAAFEIMDEIRDTFPSEFAQARQIVRERQSLLDDAEAEANRMIEDARSQAMTIASEQEIVRISQQQADQILADARELERQTRAGAEDYADEVFGARGAEPRHAAEQRAPLPRPPQRQLARRGPLMEATRIPIPSELFAPAESSHFEGTYAVPVVKAGPDLYDFAEPLAWQVDVTNTGDALLVTGTVEGEAKTSCARCVDEFSFPVTGEVEGYFLIGADREAPEDMDDDEFDVLPDDNVIDLEPLLRAALLLEFPLVPLCDEECKGLCPTCGANLNDGPCGCAPAEDAGDDAPPNPFAVLKDFPFEQN